MRQEEPTCSATDVLTLRQAMDAMVTFLTEYYRQTQSDDVGSLLGELPRIGELGTTGGDPATWSDWLRAVQRAMVPDTPEWRDAIARLVADPSAFAGQDVWGDQWYGRILSDGMQLWACVHDNTVRSAGCNTVPRSFDSKAGLSAAGYKASGR